MTDNLEPEWLAYGRYSEDDPRKLAIDAAWPNVERLGLNGWGQIDAGAKVPYAGNTYRPKQQEPRRLPDYPWHMFDESIVACAIDQYGDAYALTDIPELADFEWVYCDDPQSISFLKFDRGNVPWPETLMLKPE